MNSLNAYRLNHQETTVKVTKNTNRKILIKKILGVGLVVVLLSILLTIIFSLVGFGVNNDNFIEHEIASGESLWSISAKYYDSNKVDLRRIIYKIKKINNMDSAIISPGKKILIPIE